MRSLFVLFHLHLLFVDGSIGRISANFGSVTKHHHRLSVYGTEGTFSQGHQGAMYQFGRDKCPKEKILDQGYPAVGKDELLKNFVLELQGLCDEQISNGEIFETMNVALAIEEALQCGKAVKVATVLTFACFVMFGAPVSLVGSHIGALRTRRDMWYPMLPRLKIGADPPTGDAMLLRQLRCLRARGPPLQELGQSLEGEVDGGEHRP